MTNPRILVFLFVIFSIIGISQTAYAADFTATQSGDWSDSATWGGGGVPGDGDTATIGAFTVTVDTDTTVGTSPNDTTTKVINLTSASSILKVASGVTLTVKGNRGAVNGSKFQQEAGSTVIFDNSGSGGSPVYKDINVGFTQYVFNGSSGSGTTIQAISGQTFALSSAWKDFVASYTTFRRCSGCASNNAAGGTVGTLITHSVFDSSNTVNITQNSATLDFIFNDNVITNSTDSTDSIKVQLGIARSSGTRSFLRNVMDKQFNNLAKDLTMTDNLLGGITCYTGGATSFASPPQNNFIISAGGLNGGNGMRIVGSWTHNYVVIENSSGNPHFLAPTALAGVDETLSQIIFEAQTPDLIDLGDSILMLSSVTSGGNKVISRNNIVLPSGYSGATGSSGTLLTVYSNTTAPLFEAYNNTANINNVAGPRGVFAIAEGGNGVAGQITALKSNIAWASAGNQGYLGERVSGNVKDIITASGDDYNWTYNVNAGDNQRSYEDRVARNTLWTSGDAMTAGVDVNQGTGNPLFVDSTRNVAKWATARGYGSTFSDGVIALQADPTRISDLIDYVRAGFIPTNLALKGKAHDGGDPGAVPISVFNSTGGNVSTSLTTSFSGGMAF